MIKVHFNDKTMTFSVRLTNLKVGDSDSIPMKFDTGAVATIVGAQQLFEGFSERDRKTFEVLFRDAGIEKRSFLSATGHELVGYPCVFSNIMMSGDTVPYLPFYLIVNTDRNVSLLGNDFISFCVFEHEKESDITIKECDYGRLKESFVARNKTAFDINLLTQI